MKKLIFALLLLLAFSSNTAFAQTSASLTNTKTYAEIFGFENGVIDINDDNYVWQAPRADRLLFRDLGGELGIDTPLEFALLSYYSDPVRAIRPPEADAMLPANNPRLADQKLGAAVFQEMQILRFLGNAEAAGRHEAVLQFITSRGYATRTEIETFYRNNIRALISDVVDEEFNKISFSLENARTNSVRSHDAVLMRNPQNGQYTLNYSGYYTINGKQTITAPTLNALKTEMERRVTEFDRTGINNLEAQAALIPAVVLSDAALNEVKSILTAFYTSPNATTYLAVRETYLFYTNRRLSTGASVYELARLAYVAGLTGLNDSLALKVINDARITSSITTLTTQQQQRLVQLR